METLDIGSAIREIRKERGLTQVQLAEKAGMAVNSIRLYESGKRIPNLSVRVELADALDVSLDELATKEELKVFGQIWEIGYWDREEEFHDELEFAINEIDTRKKDPLYANLVSTYRRLNADGKREAVRSIVIIAGNPIYQRTDTTETPSEDQQGKPTTKQEKPPEGQANPSNGK